MRPQEPDTPTPLNSAGPPSQGYENASGKFDLKRELRRKINSRKDLSQPAYTEDDSITRYYGDFSIESKRHVWDLLQKHPKFRNGRIENNTQKVIGGIVKDSEHYY